MARLGGACDRRQRDLARAGPGGVEHGRARVVDLARERGREPRLARAVGADERDQTACRPARRGAPPARAGGRSSAARRRPRARRAARSRAARPSAPGRGAGSRRAARWSSGPGSTPICSTSVRARLAVGLERLRLAVAAVQREHALRVAAARAAGSRPAAPRARRRARGGGRRRGRRRSRARRRSGAAPPGGGSRRARTARRRCRPAAHRGTAPAPGGRRRTDAPRVASPTRRSKRSASISSRSICSSYACPRVTISASPPSASTLRRRQT